MKPDAFLSRIVDPTLRSLADWPSIAIPFTDAARVLVLAIAGQESGLVNRRQIGGSGRSYWQFERNGGVLGLFNTMPRQLSAVCATHDIPFDVDDVFEAMCWHDLLACSMARFLLWNNPQPLPPLGDKTASWNYYLAQWRPGVPRMERWEDVYHQALAAVTASQP